MASLFIAQLLGIYFFIIGLIAILRRKSIMPAVMDLAKDRGVILILALMELIAGIALVLTFPALTTNWQGVLSVIGYIMIVESMVYLTLSHKHMQLLVRKFNKPAWFIGGGVVSVLLGLYLIVIGFNFV